MGNAPTMRIDPNGGVDAPYEDYESIKQRALETRTYLEAQRLATYLSKGGYYDGFSSGPSSQNPLYAMNNPANFTFYNPGDGYRPEVTMNGVRGYMAQGISQHRSFYSSNPNLQYAEDSYFNVERFVPIEKNNESPAWVQGISDITGGIGILSQTGELGTDIYMNIRKSNFYNSSKTFNLGSKALNPADKYPLYASNLLKGTTVRHILQTAKVIGVAGNIVGAGIAYYNIRSGKGTVMDKVDLGVNLAGLATTGLAIIGVVSNPVGWAVGAASIVYGGVRLYQSINQ